MYSFKHCVLSEEAEDGSIHVLILLEMLLLSLCLFLLLAPMTILCGSCWWKLWGDGWGFLLKGSSQSLDKHTQGSACPTGIPLTPVSNSLNWSLARLLRWVLPSLLEAGAQLWPPVLLKAVYREAEPWIELLEMGCLCLCLPQVLGKLSCL